MIRVKRKGTKIKTSLGSKIFDVFNVCFMLVFAFVMIYPFWNQLFGIFLEITVFAAVFHGRN